MMESRGVRSHLGIGAEEVFALLDAKSDWRRLSLAAAGYARTRPRTVTYSRNISIPVTRICRNRCGYCCFSEKSSRTATPILPPQEIERLLRLGAASGCTEALFLAGERPEEASPEIAEQLAAWGYRDMLEYLVHTGETALRFGLLPHTNAGLLKPEELMALCSVNASMGLMLESSSQRLCENGGPHARSPGKRPTVRLRCIEEAGKLSIPFTTGILIGIGEEPRERIDALLLLRELHRRYGHIQEIIVQPFCPKPGTPMSSVPGPPVEEILATIAYARLIFGSSMNIQAPPNLVQAHALFIHAGANDWGGLSPLTRDLINPDNRWPDLSDLQRSAQTSGAILRERLPVYPEFISDRYLHPRVRDVVMALSDDEGYVKGSIKNGQHLEEHR